MARGGVDSTTRRCSRWRNRILAEERGAVDSRRSIPSTKRLNSHTEL
jgi:hypothetical protein